MEDKENEDDNQICVIPLAQGVKGDQMVQESDPGEADNSTRDVDLIPKDVGWAWMCCLGCFIQNSLTVGGAIKTFGVFYVAFMDHFDSQAGSAAWILVLCNASLLAGGSFTNALAMRFGARKVVFAGGLVMCLGYITSMFATQLQHLFFTYGLTIGLGCSMAWSVSLAHMGFYFRQRRAIANGIAVSGVGIGNLVLPPVARLLLDTFGLQGTLLVMGGISLNVCVAGALLRPPSSYRQKIKRVPNKIYNKDLHESNHLKNGFVSKSTSTPKTSKWNFCRNIYNIYASLEWSLLKKPLFVLHGITMILYFVGFPGYFVVLAPHAEQIGHSKQNAAYLISISGMGELVGRLSSGFIADLRIIPTTVFMALLLFMGAATAAITPLIIGYIPLACICFLFALFVGPIMALNPVLLAESFGVQKLPSGLGILGLFMAAGMVPSAPVAGSLKDLTGDWNSSFYFSAVALFLSSGTMFIRHFVSKRTNVTEERQ